MSGPSIVVNTYSGTLGHVNVSFYDANGVLQGTYGGNVGQMDGNPLNGLEGGVYDETNPSRLPIHTSTILISQENWNNAHMYSYRRMAETSVTGEGYYFLIGQNCVDFVEDVLRAAGVQGNVSDHLLPGTPTYTYGAVTDWLEDSWATILDNMRSEQSYQNYIQQYQNKFIELHDSSEILLLGRKLDDANSKEQLLVDDTWYSPIAIDVNGDGLKTTHIRVSNVFFDLNADGIQEKTGWLSSADGFVAFDRNGNGVIDDGSELFGGGGRGDGFAKLASFDTNGDALINILDTDFGSLKLWIDIDSNGKTDIGELKSLDKHGISELKTDYFTWNRWSYGNLIGEHASAVVDGNSVVMADIYFKTALLL